MAEKKRKRASLSLKTQRKVNKMATVPDNSDYDNDASTSKSQSKNKVKKFGLLKILIPSVLLLAVFLTYIIIGALHPVGVFEYLGSLTAAGGSGAGYDVDIFGGKPKYTISDGDIYYLVTDTSVNCYNVNGKSIFERSHAFSDPVVKVSETRYLLYGQGETELSVSTLTESLYLRNFDNTIITAALSDSGSFAVATKADGYDSAVYVFDKDNAKVYEWYSSGETVNTVSLSPDGDTLAVSTISIKDGSFCSNIYFLNYDSADAVYKYTSNDNMVYGLYESGSDTFCAAFSDNVIFLNYEDKTIKENPSEYSVSIIKHVDDKFVVSRSVAANQEQSVFEVYDEDGERLSSYNVSSLVTDFSYDSDNLYLLGVSKAYKYDQDGKLVAEADVSYDSLYIESVSNSEIACVRNSIIEKIDLIDLEE